MNKCLFTIALLSSIIFHPFLFSQTNERIVVNCGSSDREVIINGKCLDSLCPNNIAYCKNDSICIMRGKELCFTQGGVPYNHKPKENGFKGTFASVIPVIPSMRPTVIGAPT